MGIRSEDGRDKFKTYGQSAIEIPGPEAERPGEPAHDHDMHMVIGGVEREGILTTEIDLDEISCGRYDLDVVGPYARPDVFRPHLNESPMPAVVRSIQKNADPFKDPEA